MVNEFNFGLKQKFNIKCLLDLIVFIIACILFVLFAKLNHAAPYDTLVFLIIVILLNFSVHFVTKQWISKSIRQAMTVQSNSLAETTSEFMETVNTQKRMFEDLAGNTKTISSLIENLKGFLKITTQLRKMLKSRLINLLIFHKKNTSQSLLMQIKCLS